MEPLFCVKARRAQVARAAKDFSPFLFKRVVENVLERLRDVRRDFSSILVCSPPQAPAVEPWIREIYPQADIFLTRSLDFPPALPPRPVSVVLSLLEAHWIEDLPGYLSILKSSLEPDGLAVVALWGGDTLCELRRSFTEAECALSGGAHSRVMPFLPLQTGAALLQRCGFALPVADHDTLTCAYPNLKGLVQHLRQMGESYSLAGVGAPRTLFEEAEKVYRKRYALNTGELPATFQLITLTGWAPAPHQPRPLKPGSATHRLEDVL